MKKQILFVDDDAMVLQGIQRLLRPMREEWEMDFIHGGLKAMSALSRTNYDVVVTDMMMPGMDGTELLACVKEHSPKTIRLVLSGHAEPHMAMKCVGLAHQYLAKPCEAGTLKAVLARLMEPSFALRNEHIMTLVAQLEHLPSIPGVYLKMVKLLNNPNSSLEEVGAVIARDMAMTAKILKIVNSSFFGLARRVSQPAEAASFLGIDTLKALALATNVFGQFETKMPPGFSATKAADRSQEVGAAARAIARVEKAPRAVIDESLVAGMLIDVGKLMLASSLPEQFQKVGQQKDVTELEAERTVFGATHAEVGGYLLGLWGLPPAVVEAITLHHSPGDSHGQEFCALTAAHVADGLIAERDTPEGETPAWNLNTDYLTRLSLAERLPVWRAALLDSANAPDTRD